MYKIALCSFNKPDIRYSCKCQQTYHNANLRVLFICNLLQMMTRKQQSVHTEEKKWTVLSWTQAHIQTVMGFCFLCVGERKKVSFFRNLFWIRQTNWKECAIWSLHFLGKTKHFIQDPSESRYDPETLMKRVKCPANILTGPWWLVGNTVKWLLSDLVCLSTAVSAPVAQSAAPVCRNMTTVQSSPGIRLNSRLI